MDQHEVFRRYLELGTAFTSVTRDRAEELMKELVRLGELQREQAQQWVDDVLDRSRKNTEALLDLVRDEVARQLSSTSLVTKDDVSRLVTRLTRAPAAVRKTTKKAAKKVSTKRAPAGRAKKAPARKTTTKKTTTKKASARKAASKSTAKRAPARKSTKKAGS